MAQDQYMQLQAFAIATGNTGNFVVLKEDEHGRYIEYAFREGAPMTTDVFPGMTPSNRTLLPETNMTTITGERPVCTRSVKSMSPVCFRVVTKTKMGTNTVHRVTPVRNVLKPTLHIGHTRNR